MSVEHGDTIMAAVVTSKNIVVDDRMDSYQSFFDGEWARRVSKVAEGTPLDPFVFDLAFSWRGAANTHRMPWMMVQAVKSFENSYRSSVSSLSDDFVQAVRLRLLSEMGDRLQPEQRHELQAKVDRIEGDVRAVRSTIGSQVVFNPKQLWDEWVVMSEFQFCLQASQRLAFGALLYAYEDFLLRCFRLQSGKADYQIGRKFSEDFAAAFSIGLRDYCWSDPEVNVARQVRHALVHNGGRETDTLRKLGHGIRVEDGELQIMPPHTKALFEILKVRVERFVREAVSRLPFSAA
jgi:hypothetical protein